MFLTTNHCQIVLQVFSKHRLVLSLLSPIMWLIYIIAPPSYQFQAPPSSMSICTHASIINMWSRHTKWLCHYNITQIQVFKHSTHPAHPPEQGNAWLRDAGLMPSHLVLRRMCSLPPWYHHWLPDVWILDQQVWAGRMKLGHGTPEITMKLTRAVYILQYSWYLTLPSKH